MTYTDIMNYFKEVFPEIENFYVFKRDDNKEKSLTVYKINGIANENQLGGNIHKQMGCQIQLVFTNSALSSEQKIKELCNYIASTKTQIKQINNKEFYIVPKNSDEDFFYFGTVGNGCFYYGIDLLIYY